MKKVAITGTIGSGKTTVSILLRRKGYPVFDADGYSHICLQKNHDAYHKIVSVFGEDILDVFGEIDRSQLASLVFSDEEKREQLNAIVHPYVKDGLFHFFESCEKEHVSFAEIPLLYEVGWEKYFDEVLLVTCSKDVAITRLQEYRHYRKAEAISRYESQYDIAYKKEKADDILENDGTLEELNEELERYLERKNPWN